MKMKTHKNRMERRVFSGETFDLGTRLLSFLFVALLLGGLCPSTSAAGSIGVNLNSSIPAAVDLVTGTAGAVPQANWNNVSNITGTVSAGSVIDSSGATVGGMSVSWSGDAAWSVGGLDGTGEGDDTALMHGGFEEQHTTYGLGSEVSLTGIPYTRYNLYAYVKGWNADRDGEIQIKVGGSVVSGSQRQFKAMGTEFIDGTHSHSESTGSTDIGTYVLWEDLT